MPSSRIVPANYPILQEKFSNVLRSPVVAEKAVAGKTYVLENSPNPDFPVYLIFGDIDSKSVLYGSALDGYPGGVYFYKANCHLDIQITFVSSLIPNSSEETVFWLKAGDLDFNSLKVTGDSKLVFRLVDQ